jgi:CRISPR-associated protein Cas2
LEKKKQISKKKELTFVEKMLKLSHAGISDNNVMISCEEKDISDIPYLEERVKQLLNLINNPHNNPTNMIFFVMYDIESDKVRVQVAKYLLRCGCYRIQRSIFLADLEQAKYIQMKKDLVAVQAAYDNQDSILFVPISTDYLKAMKVIGKNIDVDIITKSKNTLFF